MGDKMDKKAFLEVFPDIDMKDECLFYFKEALVEEVLINKDKKLIQIYLQLNQITHKKFIIEVEKILKNKLCQTSDLEIELIDRYHLEPSYSLKKLWMLYKDSIIYEIKCLSPICSGILSDSEFIIHDNSICVKLKNKINTLKERQISSIIEKTVKDKFDWTINVTLETCEQSNEAHQEFESKRDEKEQAIISQIVSAQPVIKEKVSPIPKENKAYKSSSVSRAYKTTSEEGMILGRKINGMVTPIQDIQGEYDEIITDGTILSVQVRELKSGKYLMVMDITNFLDSITIKCFLRKEQYENNINNKIKKGMTIRVKGQLQFDTYSKETNIMCRSIMAIDPIKKERVDTHPIKRIELNAHTRMSDMDGIASAKALIEQAVKWGHEAIAITDYGVVQAYPDAFHAAHGKDIKVIYGLEAYLVDDLKSVVKYSKNQSLNGHYIIFDIETTGFYPGRDKITEIGAVRVKDGKIIDSYSSLINPQVPIPPKVVKLTGITDEMVKNERLVDEVLPEFIDFIEDAVLVAHNADFDISFIKYYASQLGMSVDNTILDTLELARALLKNLKNHKLNTIAKELNVSLENHHRAVDDAKATADIFIEFKHRLGNNNVYTLDELEQFCHDTGKNVKKLKYYHATILTKNLTGLRNLYELVSKSHIDYFFKKPRIPKSVYLKYKDGLLIGSACEAGELYRAILGDKPKEEINAIVDFYDYLEIQPVGNSEYLLREGAVENRAALESINRQIVALGDEHNKNVVATSDVHFLNPEDEVYRRIIKAGQGFKDADFQAPLYFRTTDEMLQEFQYLGQEVAEAVVIHNTKKIANSIECIDPVPPDKYPPVIEGSDAQLREICYNKAMSIYGDPLPQLVKKRLDRELNSIISNGFAVMYIIAQKLVWKSNEHGYLVGSRGSVGSSFAATMSGITEVNPLPPHYICPHCDYVDFDSDAVKSNSGNSGCDMPDRVCPKCGHALVKEGHDIPFETFLGFKGNKEPDIDLNFSGDYQSKAHEYTEVLFGEGHVFRAGTIGTLADKTAYGFVKKYFDEKNVTKRNAEINRLVAGCTGIRRTTGQHPGGIIVVPSDQEIYKFTPVQRPANDMKTKIITTHFDYHSIDHNLLKLDILGHDDPTMIKMLEDLTGKDAKTIPLDEHKVMSLFKSTEALGIKPEDIGGCPIGSLGIPEFGTDFVIQMLLDTKPKTFSDLVRISGLSHGTDVWLNNAQELIKNRKADISRVISTRDDIMTYLIHQGLDKELSFTIMESVRKGKGLKEEWEKAMLEKEVPDWYIWSCKQIKYMFPKAHAVAYVMMAYRIAYFKVYYPAAYYTAFFSIRASDFDYEIMCHGKGKLDQTIHDYKSRLNELTKKEKDTLKDMKIVQEMYARGIGFMPIDLYKVHASQFQMIDNKIMPSLSAIQGLGEKAAENIVVAREAGPFLSIDDLRQRTKISKTVIEVMKTQHIIDDLPESNQLSLF